ncbi:sensor histidine kinase [Romboutsia sp. 1001713B170131_170501_G6]|uniref:sensor histidine kinase n=1 Tax=Romboutsia sp. 1001713B170131_170501_G6 TaxID=2787108 RepID=UPI0018AC0311|nr:histidine kinase [Romboutsia sp. 1001713B170131_170501_G6]
MILRIIVNIILAVDIFLYGMENDIYFDKVSYPICIALISISLSVYMLYIIKFKNIKILLGNILYMIIVTYLYPPSLAILTYMITEYIQVKGYKGRYILLSVYTILSIKIGLNYTHIFIGIVASIFTYEIMRYKQKILKLERSNYDLKEKNYKIEEIRKKENRISHQNVEAIKIEERNMISQKLHDNIGHTLAGSIMQLEALKIVIVNDREKGNEMLENIITNLRNGMDDIRKTLRKIKPNQSQVNINNLRLMLEEFSNKSKIITKLNIEGDLNEINLVYWKAIIECCSEILTNSMKYSNGELINIDISVLNKIIRLHIKDNGYYQGEIKKGMGLLGIEERIINLGGDIYFNNEDGFSNLIILKRGENDKINYSR